MARGTAGILILYPLPFKLAPLLFLSTRVYSAFGETALNSTHTDAALPGKHSVTSWVSKVLYGGVIRITKVADAPEAVRKPGPLTSALATLDTSACRTLNLSACTEKLKPLVNNWVSWWKSALAWKSTSTIFWSPTICHVPLSFQTAVSIDSLNDPLGPSKLKTTMALVLGASLSNSMWMFFTLRPIHPTWPAIDGTQCSKSSPASKNRAVSKALEAKMSALVGAFAAYNCSSDLTTFWMLCRSAADWLMLATLRFLSGSDSEAGTPGSITVKVVWSRAFFRISCLPERSTFTKSKMASKS